MRVHELFEADYTDLYPKAFEVFRAKYLPLAARPDLYVNFNDHVDNTLNKSFSDAPTHNDPWGLYAYPLDYVLNHPADIAYGQQARYLRVIQATAANKLVLTSLSEPQVLSLLGHMGATDPKKLISTLQASLTRSKANVTGNKFAKYFFWIMQQLARRISTTRPGYNKAQTALLLKAGIDALEDKASTPAEATIYQDEPEQIIFLKRSAFRVVETYDLRSQQSANLSKADRTETLRRLPAMIAQAIGDTLVSSNTTGDRAEEQSYYTAAKRKIVLAMEHVWDFSKVHRERSTHGPEKMTVLLSGPGFATIRQTYEPTISFRGIAADIAQRFANRTQAEGQSFDLDSEYGADIRHATTLLAAVAAKLQLPFTATMTPKTELLVYKTMRLLTAKTGVFKGKDDYVERGVIPTVNQFWNTQKSRAPQADQIIAIFKAAAANRKLKFSWNHGGASMAIASIAQQLGVGGDAAANKRATGSSFRKEYAGGFAIARQGTDLVFDLNGQTQTVAQIENNKLDRFTYSDDFQTADRTAYLPFARDIAAYFNSQHFTVSGYALYLPERYGVFYKDGTWQTVENDLKPIATLKNGLPLYAIPDRDDRDDHYICAKVPVEIAAPGQSEPTKGVELLNLMSVDADNKLSHVSDTLNHWYDHLRKKRENYRGYNPWPRYGVHDDSAAQKAWDIVLGPGGFDLKRFVKQMGYGFGPNLAAETLHLFGLMRNEDTKTIGPTLASVLAPVGEFDGATVASVKLTGIRSYYLAGEQPLMLFSTAVNGYYGKDNVGITEINPKLTAQQRKITKDVIAECGLRVPKKFAPLLAMRGVA